MTDENKLIQLKEKQALIAGKLMLLNSVVLDPSKLKAKIKIDRRMKLYIKLDQAQTETWNFMKKVFDNTSDDQLALAIFVNGLIATQKEMEKQVKSIQEEMGVLEADYKPDPFIPVESVASLPTIETSITSDPKELPL